jgi:hypothetical protein
MNKETTMKKIERPEIVTALRLAHDEIIRLRRKVELLEPKAHAYDTLAQVARLTIHEPMQVHGEDPAWRVKNMVDRLVAEREAERTDNG